MSNSIEIRPTWRATFQIYMAALVNGTEEGQIAAQHGLMDTAEMLDRLADQYRLINAAPELLDLLEKYAFRWDGADQTPEGKALYLLARAAIAKARGED